MPPPAVFIFIAAEGDDTTTLSHAVAVKLKNPKNLRPARAVNPHAEGVSKAVTTTLGPLGPSNLRTLRPKAGQTSEPFAPKGRTPLNPGRRAALFISTV